MSTTLDAREANSAENWDTLWEREGQESWRGKVLDSVYARICELIPSGSKVLDIGGGVGIFAKRLRDERECEVTIWDISPKAVEMARQEGFSAEVVDVEAALELQAPPGVNVVVSTECLEHLSQEARDRILALTSKAGFGYFTVPNDRLGPEVEPQHTIQFTAMSFKRQLLNHFNNVRVEVVGPGVKEHVPGFLLGVCGVPKNFKLSFTMPVRNEARDIERTLASFRAAADEIVIGIDPRSNDNTREIALKYADLVFDLVDPTGESAPEDLGKAPPGKGVHFAWIRNQCMDKCTGDWIFMSEGHESLLKGTDVLLHLDKLMPEGAKIGYVWRTGQGQRWAFPWLTNGHDKRLRYKRATHNDLQRPDDAMEVKMPNVETWHFRDHAASEARKAQRKVQNRVSLTDDWYNRKSEHSLWHLASEWREFDKDKAISLFEEYLRSDSKVGDARYQSRLIIAKEHALLALEAREKGDAKECESRFKKAREVLLPATGDNWWRTEHWIALGDIAAEQELWEEALQFYKYSATQLNNPPFVLWWIDDCAYTYLPCQRLTTTYAALGMYAESLEWAKKVVELLPPDAPEELRAEASDNVRLLEEALVSN